MFSHDNYTVFMISMRIGKQGTPLWFRCFKDKDDSKAFDEKYLKKIFPMSVLSLTLLIN